VCVALAVLLPSLHAQQVTKNAGGDPRARIVQQAIADLADPTRELDAQRRLVNVGAFAVPALREQLQRRRDEVPDAHRVAMVSALGRFGRAAVPALPELRQSLEADGGTLTVVAAWSIGNVLPFADAAGYRDVVTDVQRLGASVSDADPRLATLFWQARLGAPTTESMLCGWLRQEAVGTIAAARWIRAHPLTIENRSVVQGLLRDRLEERMQRMPVSWQGPRPGWFGNDDLADAWRALSRAELDGVVARALLDDWVVDDRLVAIAWLRDHGATLPFRERADLVGRLWDRSPDVAIATAEALGAWGKAGLVGLAPLRSHQAAGLDERFAAACGAAADLIVASFASSDEAERELVAACDAATRRTRPAAAKAKPTAAMQQLAAEVLFLGQWQDAVCCAHLLDAVDAAWANDDDTVRAVCGWLQHDDGATVAAAFAWLARCGTPATDAVAAPLPWFVRYSVAFGARPAATEAMAWLATARGEPGTLRELCSDENLRTTARALAALLAQPTATSLPSPERLRELASLQVGHVLVQAHNRDDGIAIGNDVSAPMRALAAIALADAKLELPADPALAKVVKDRCGVELPSLQAHVATLREKGELVALLDRLEAEMRTCMGVAPALRWPSTRAK
jgi:hypothetical protein